MSTLTRPKYDFKPHVRIERASKQTSMSQARHLEVVEDEFTKWLRRHKWKRQAGQFAQTCRNVRKEFPDYESRIIHYEYFINLTIEGFKTSISRRLNAS